MYTLALVVRCSPDVSADPGPLQRRRDPEAALEHQARHVARVCAAAVAAEKVQEELRQGKTVST